MRQWLAPPCGESEKIFRSLKRSVMGCASQSGRGEARSVLVFESREGIAWRRRWEREIHLFGGI